MICFHFSIFEPLETVNTGTYVSAPSLWFAFILVSLNHWKQYILRKNGEKDVVICFHFSIFEPLETVAAEYYNQMSQLWFAFILVSLNHWKQWSISDIFRLRSCDLLSFLYLWTIGNSQNGYLAFINLVVICFHFSIFEPLETVFCWGRVKARTLWFAFILVSLNHWKQWKEFRPSCRNCCDLLSF